MNVVLIANENVDHAPMLVCNYYASKKEVHLLLCPIFKKNSLRIILVGMMIVLSITIMTKYYYQLLLHHTE